MRRLLGLLLLLPIWLFQPTQAHAQSSVALWCFVSAAAPQYQPCSASNPLSVSGTFSGTVSSGATASSSLPSLSAGSNAIYESLSGGQYVQPVVGTQIVDSTHGMPVTPSTSTGATAPTVAQLSGCIGLSTAQTAVTTGQMTGLPCGLDGKLTNLPYAVKELMVRGTVDSTDGSAHTIIASAGGSSKNYITDWECANTSSTTVTVTFNDSVSTKIIVPAGGGNNKSLHIPLVTAAATAFQFTASTGVSTVTCSAQGYTGL